MGHWNTENNELQDDELNVGSDVDDESGLNHVRKLKLKYPLNILISYINVNSIQNKFTDLALFIGENFDIITIAETKLDDSFPSSQFFLPGY